MFVSHISQTLSEQARRRVRVVRMDVRGILERRNHFTSGPKSDSRLLLLLLPLPPLLLVPVPVPVPMAGEW